jgi:chemotaxis protein MotB
VIAVRWLCCLGVMWLALGCVTRGTHREVVIERDQLVKQRRELKVEVERLEAANWSLTTERLALLDELEDQRVARFELQGEVSELSRRQSELSEGLASTQAELAARTTEIARMRNTYDGLVSDLEDEVAAGQIQISKLRSGLQMNLSEAILFPSGSAALNASGVAVLRKVGRRLAELPHSIDVEGHTDDVPIGRSYPSNWELAAARASSVVRLLAELGVDPKRLTATSRGEFAPVASNQTPEGRASNRRIEIRLEPVAGAGDRPASQPEGGETDSEPAAATVRDGNQSPKP